MDRNIPSEADWRSEPWDLDIPYAYKNFFGKSLPEAFELFVENALYYQEDIMFMPLACFRYYIHAYISYLKSDKSEGDSDGASCFFGIVECRESDIRGSDHDLIKRISEVLMLLGQRQDWYGAEPDIYGNFRDRAADCLEKINGS